MSTKTDKIIRMALIIVFFGSLFIGFFIIQAPQFDELEKDIKVYEERINAFYAELPNVQKLTEQRDLVKERLETENAGAYEKDTMFLDQFGIDIKQVLEYFGLEVIRYQTVKDKYEELVEFSVTGRVDRIMRFLYYVETIDKYWKIPFLNLKTKSDNNYGDVLFRIGYETKS